MSQGRQLTADERTKLLSAIVGRAGAARVVPRGEVRGVVNAPAAAVRVTDNVLWCLHCKGIRAFEIVKVSGGIQGVGGPTHDGLRCPTCGYFRS